MARRKTTGSQALQPLAVIRVRRALAAGAAAMAVLAGCSTATFQATEPGSIESVLSNAGAEVCDQGASQTALNGATEARWYEVARDCAVSTDPALLVGVLTFDSEAAWNAAYSQHLHQLRTPRPSAVYRYGDTVVVLSLMRDRALARDIVAGLNDLGAT